jgi:hypothetical protein
MQTAIDASTGLPVNVDGSPAQMGLIDGKAFLHILPRLWLPYGGIDTKVHSSVWLESLIIPELGIDTGGEMFKPSRPFPNESYVIFGNERRMGWMIPLEQKLPSEINIRYVYVLSGDFSTLMASHYLEVIHDQKIKIEPSELGVNDCYSTEHCLPGFICKLDYDKTFKEKSSTKVIDFGHPLVTGDSEDYYSDTWELETTEVLNPLPHRYVSSLQFETFEPFHAKQQLVGLTTLNDKHFDNAIVEMPYFILRDAIHTAPKNSKTQTDALPENHPALMLLCTWWNENDSVPAELKNAKTCQIFVRMNEDDSYQDIDLQVPAIPITSFPDEFKQCSARVGDHFIIVFLKGRADLVEQEHYTEHFLVNGIEYENCGLSAEEYLPGWFTLMGLAKMPAMFPHIIEFYKNSVGNTQILETEKVAEQSATESKTSIKAISGR